MMIIVEEPPAYLLKQVEALLSLPIASPPSREEVEDKAVEAPDRDDLLHGYDDGVVQLRHDGSLPLQVLGDIGVVDLVKRHHLWSNLLVQNDVVVVSQGHVSK